MSFLFLSVAGGVTMILPKSVLQDSLVFLTVELPATALGFGLTRMFYGSLGILTSPLNGSLFAGLSASVQKSKSGLTGVSVGIEGTSQCGDSRGVDATEMSDRSNSGESWIFVTIKCCSWVDRESGGFGLFRTQAECTGTGLFQVSEKLGGTGRMAGVQASFSEPGEIARCQTSGRSAIKKDDLELEAVGALHPLPVFLLGIGSFVCRL
jgi:hypothetical protein